MTKRTPVSAENKSIAKYAAAAFGGVPHVREHLHDSEPLTIDILWCDDRPIPGVTAFSTVGLSDHRMSDGQHEFATRLELAGACATRDRVFSRILATAAFCIMRSCQIWTPGSILDDGVSAYMPSSGMRHLYFTTPFLWAENLKSIELATKTVGWLLAVPISDDEREYCKREGDDALESLFEAKNIDVFDLERPSVV